MNRISVLLFFLFFVEMVLGESAELVLKRVEKNLEMTSDVRASVQLVQKKADQGTKVIDLIYYRRDADDSFLIVMIAPESEKGNGYLRVGENFWMYRRNTRTFQHINRDESIAGTDAKGDDFENRKLTELYEGAKDESGEEIFKESLLGKIEVYELEIRAKVNDVDYPKKILWVRRDSFLPLKEQAFSASGTLMQTAYYPKYTVVNDRYIPVEQIFIDEFEKGNKTIVNISNISLDKVDDGIFSKGYLENLSK